MKKKLITAALVAGVACAAAACGFGAAPAEKKPDAPAPAPKTETAGETVTTAGGYEVSLTQLAHRTTDEKKPVVYFTKDITPDVLIRAYEAVGREASGRVAVKLHTGESEKSNYLRPDFVAPLVQKLGATIVECNTAYGGSRANTALHEQVVKDRGFTAIAPVDIMDSEGSMALPVAGGVHLKENLVGSHFGNYDFFVVISHFKGHAMGGFGGALKNISIGMASSEGKSLIHTGGTERSGFGWGFDSKIFTESMAEAAESVSDAMGHGEKMLYINVMNRISVDCDCDGNPAEPDMHDVGILASTDPVALDQACVDFLYAVPDSASVLERMHSRGGEHILDRAAELGFGNREYRLETIL